MAQVVKLNTMKMPNFNPLSNYIIGEFTYYIVEKTIGQGTFGKVKLGTHKSTGEKVNFKLNLRLPSKFWKKKKQKIKVIYYEFSARSIY